MIFISEDVPRDTSTNFVLSPIGPITSRIDIEGDKDLFVVNLIEGLSYEFKMEGTGSSSERLTGRMQLDLYDSGGGRIAGNFLGTSPSTLVYTAEDSGRHYIEVEGSYLSLNTGQYTLYLNGEDSIGNNIRAAGSLSSNMSVTSRIDVEGDKDLFEVNLIEGQSYEFEMEGTGSSSERLTGRMQMDLYDSGGGRVKGSFLSTSPNTITYNAEESGRHYIEVKGSYLSPNTGQYTISLNGGGSGDNGLGSSTSLSRGEVMDVARLYGGAFGRQPDEAGVNFWINQAEEGQSRVEAAGYFLDSIEFTDNFGNDDLMTNEQFISTMYQNVLSRGEDASGFDFWVEQMDNGLSRENTLIYFSDSPENIEKSDYLNNFQEVVDGFWSFI